MRRLLVLLAVLLWPAAALAQDPPVDPLCPQGDLQTPRLPGSVCIGRMSSAYHFAFIYPAEIAEIRPLLRRLRAEAVRSEAWIAGEARRFQRERIEAGNEPFPLSYEEGWRLDLTTPLLAAASARVMHYTGGAHEGIEYRALMLDRRSGRRLALADLFTDLAPLQIALCENLQRDLRERGHSEAQPVCPELTSLPVTLSGGEDGRAHGITALIAPYVVGSWAEGPYEVDVVLIESLLPLVRPAYRPSFQGFRANGAFFRPQRRN